MPRFCPSECQWIIRALQASHPDPWAQIGVSYMCSLCVHTPTPKQTPIRVKNKEDIDNTPISPCVKNIPPRQATSALVD